MKTLIFVTLLLLTKISASSQITQVTEQQLFGAFKQDFVKFQGIIQKLKPGGGNCASIALIKAAIGTFGVNGVFKNVSIDSANRIVNVTLQDNSLVDLNFDRLKNGKEYFFIEKIGTDETSKMIADYARFCFAVMCRKKQMIKGYNKYGKAVDKLNKGQDASEIYKLLGLKKEQIEDFSIDNLKNYRNVVTYNVPHAVYSSSGNYDEFFKDNSAGGQYISIQPLDKLSTIHCRSGSTCSITGAYILK